MSIRFTCSCGRKVRATDEQAGRHGKCPACGTSLLVPLAPITLDFPIHTQTKDNVRRLPKSRVDPGHEAFTLFAQAIAAQIPFAVLLVFSLVTATTTPLRSVKTLKVENFDKIQVGMTRTEVESLLGGPPGNYGRYNPPSLTRSIYAPQGVSWYDDAHRFEIYFNEKNWVTRFHELKGYQQRSATGRSFHGTQSERTLAILIVLAAIGILLLAWFMVFHRVAVVFWAVLCSILAPLSLIGRVLSLLGGQVTDLGILAIGCGILFGGLMDLLLLVAAGMALRASFTVRPRKPEV